MLMTAGLGTRLRPFTDTLSKPLIPLLGVPMVQYNLDLLSDFGIREIVCNLHHQSDQTRAQLEKLDHPTSRLNFSDESQKLLGSGGGVRRALDQLGSDPFFLINADVVSASDLRRLEARHRDLRARHGVVMTLLLRSSIGEKGQYTEIDVNHEQGLIRGHRPAKTEVLYYASVGILEPEALQGLPDYTEFGFVSQILDPWVKKGKVGFDHQQIEWHDIGTPELWLESHSRILKMLENPKCPRLWRTRIEKANTRLSAEAWIQKGLSMPSETVIRPPFYWGASPEGVIPSVDQIKQAVAGRDLGPNFVHYGLPGSNYAEFSVRNTIGITDLRHQIESR